LPEPAFFEILGGSDDDPSDETGLQCGLFDSSRMSDGREGRRGRSTEPRPDLQWTSGM